MSRPAGWAASRAVASTTTPATRRRRRDDPPSGDAGGLPRPAARDRAAGAAAPRPRGRRRSPVAADGADPADLAAEELAARAGDGLAPDRADRRGRGGAGRPVAAGPPARAGGAAAT